MKNATLTRISGFHRDRIVALALDRDGAYAATAGLDGTVAIWPTTDPAAPTLLSGYQPPITALTFANDLTLIATHSDSSLSIWDTTAAAQGSPAASSPQPASLEIIPVVPPHPGDIVAITSSTDSTLVAVALASADSLGTLALLDLDTGLWTVIDRYSGFIIALAASNRFELIFALQSSIDGPGRLSLRDGQTGELLTEFPIPSHHPAGLALRPDGRLLAVAGAGGAIWLWGLPAE